VRLGLRMVSPWLAKIQRVRVGFKTVTAVSL
jgi:hypothetical protein